MPHYKYNSNSKYYSCKVFLSQTVNYKELYYIILVMVSKWVLSMWVLLIYSIVRDKMMSKLLHWKLRNSI